MNIFLIAVQIALNIHEKNHLMPSQMADMMLEAMLEAMFASAWPVLIIKTKKTTFNILTVGFFLSNFCLRYFDKLQFDEKNCRDHTLFYIFNKIGMSIEIVFVKLCVFVGVIMPHFSEGQTKLDHSLRLRSISSKSQKIHLFEHKEMSWKVFTAL